ncbi:hypothetical protein F4805DRAFT_268580 [Annulohypoxylon moriforme]|nr:hypothetical protein F4805DRAFT_268580 [Annulohypoxylon moriforme]
MGPIKVSAKRTLVPTMDTPERSMKKRRISIELVENDKYADVQLACQGKVWKLHRAVLCNSSPWFEKALNGEFTESGGNINIQKWDPKHIDQMITFMYEGELPFIENSKIMDLIMLWQVGDYFLISDMCEQLLDQSKEGFEEWSFSVLKHFPYEEDIEKQEATSSIDSEIVDYEQNTVMQVATQFRIWDD